MNQYLNAFKNYATFKGRASRSDYWYFYLFNLIITILFAFLGVDLLYYIYSLAIFIPSCALLARRAHDVNLSGWFMLIPIYNLILCCTPGTVGDNKYGANPKELV
ncbi:MAG: DUF805 domain-containing protein [Clostridium sp.]